MCALDHVQPGQDLEISAVDWNAAMDAARAHRGAAGIPPTTPALPYGGRGEVLIKNASGSDRGRNDVLGISDVLYTPTDNLNGFRTRPILEGATPAVADHVGRFVVLLEPIANGKIGRAVADGLAVCQIEVTADGSSGDGPGEYADVADGQADRLAAGGGGSARVLWREGGDGLQWAVVLLGAGLPGTVDAPYELLPAEEDLLTETSQTDEWDRDDPPAGTKGVAVWRYCRPALDFNGDATSYAFFRLETYDSAGRLVSFGPEVVKSLLEWGPC